jgi:hypothetical protein
VRFQTPILTILVFIICCARNTDPVVGPCVHQYLDPIIRIENVSDGKSGQEILSIKINHAQIDSMEINLQYLMNNVCFNVVLYDSALYCSTPCGFGTEDGEYILSVSSVGYRDTTISVTAQYQTFKGGCPSSSSGSTVISFEMNK